ncbi:MAG TPA: thioredoxin family protein [Phycisphaerales bacterium]|nr:thioredoxin family protein [Phycisphaerales bacterium]
MAQTPSTMMLELGANAPDFALSEPLTGKTWSLKDFAGQKALVVMFICNHCPFVKHIREGMAKLGRDYGAKGVAIVAINPNDVAKYPDDAPDKMAAEAKAAGYTFPYLFDSTQEIAKAYRAACTPDFFVFDANRRLVYRGQFDDSRPSKGPDGQYVGGPVTGKDLRAAIDATLAGKPAAGQQFPSIGCNIKWKAGNEPGYFKS